MKNLSFASILFAIGILGFSGCAYKTVSDTDQCSKTYTATNCNQPNAKPIQNNTPCEPTCTPCPQAPKVAPKPQLPKNTPILTANKPLKIRVTGQGVAPCNGTCSPSQAYAMAKRAAIADAYRLIAEKVKGVYVEGEDYIQNMMVKRSTVRTSVSAMVRNANIVETTFKEGLCEVEMEITLSRSQLLK